MAVEKRQYTMMDMVEQPIKTAPSLDLPALTVKKFFLPRDGGRMMLFSADVTKGWLPEGGCPICHRSDELKRAGHGRPRNIRDVVRNNYGVQIVMRPPRLQCKRCEYRFTPVVDGISESRNMTDRLYDYIRVECFLQPHVVLQERCGVGLPTIQEIMDEQIDKFEKYRKEHPETAPRVLGIDEKHIVHAMRGTLVDVENGRLLDMTEKNDKRSMMAAIRKLDGWDKNIEVVTTDMSNSYIRWLPELLPSTTIVIDKFHVVQDVQTKMNKTRINLYRHRKALINAIQDSGEKARQQGVLDIVNENRRLFNYSSERIARDKSGRLSMKMDTIMKEFPEYRLLRMIYVAMEEIYDQTTREAAEQKWDEWQELLPPSGKKEYEKWCDLYSVDPQCFEAFRSLSRGGFTTFKSYILNYFEPGCRHTNAATEGLNNLIESINKSGNGYRFKHLRAKALYASLIHERIVYSFDLRSVQDFSSFGWNYGTLLSYGESSGRSSSFLQYRFNEDVLHGSFDPADLLKGKDYLPKMLDSELTKQVAAPSEIDDENAIAACYAKKSSGKKNPL